MKMKRSPETSAADNVTDDDFLPRRSTRISSRGRKSSPKEGQLAKSSLKNKIPKFDWPNNSKKQKHTDEKDKTIMTDDVDSSSASSSSGETSSSGDYDGISVGTSDSSVESEVSEEEECHGKTFQQKQRKSSQLKRSKRQRTTHFKMDPQKSDYKNIQQPFFLSKKLKNSDEPHCLTDFDEEKWTFDRPIDDDPFSALEKETFQVTEAIRGPFDENKCASSSKRTERPETIRKTPTFPTMNHPFSVSPSRTHGKNLPIGDQQYLQASKVEITRSRIASSSSSSADGGDEDWNEVMLSDGDGDNSNSQTTSAKNDGIQIELDEKAVKELLKHSRFGDLLQQQKQQSFPTLDGKREEELEGEEDWQTEVRRELNRRERELLENTHRVHVLLAIAHLRFLVCSVLVGPSSSEQLTKALESLSNSLYMKSSAPVGSHPTTAQQMLALAKRFSREFSRLLESGGEMMEKPGLEAVAAMEYCPERLRRVAESRSYSSDWELPALFFSFCRQNLGVPVRICFNVVNMTSRFATPKQTSKRPSEKGDCEPKTGSSRKGGRKRKKIDDKISPETETETQYVTRLRKMIGEEVDREGRPRPQTDSLLISVDSNEGISDEQIITHNFWNEFFDELQQRWICIDVFNGTIDAPEEIESTANHPISYVLAVDDELGVRELSAKYSSQYLSLAFRKRQTSRDWLAETFGLPVLRPKNEAACRLEDTEIHERLRAFPIPTKISEFKGHPLYVLDKDLLKFEAVYPPDTRPLGECAGGKYKIFPRSAVHKLEGSLNWIKQARTIRDGERPYKVVKARPKLNVPREHRAPLTLEVFGYWQTEPYVPPEIVDGKIPRNEFGNVYMYRPEMVPKSCVHLRLPGVFQIARRMEIDAVPAVVGWQFAGCQNVPILDGCVIAQQDEEVLRAAWRETNCAKAAQKAKRTSERVWANWRRLIRAKTILERIRRQFSS